MLKNTSQYHKLCVCGGGNYKWGKNCFCDGALEMKRPKNILKKNVVDKTGISSVKSVCKLEVIC